MNHRQEKARSPRHSPLCNRLAVHWRQKATQLFGEKLLFLHKSEKRPAGCSRNEVTRLVGGVVMRREFNNLHVIVGPDLWMWMSQTTLIQRKDPTKTNTKLFTECFRSSFYTSQVSQAWVESCTRMNLINHCRIPRYHSKCMRRMHVCINLCVPHHKQHDLRILYIHMYLPATSHSLVLQCLSNMVHAYNVDVLSKSCSGKIHVR